MLNYYGICPSLNYNFELIVYTVIINKSSETAEQCPLFWPGGAVQAGKAEGGEESGQTER